MKIKGGKFLVTGGASMIGAHITEQLLAGDAREVVLLDNFALGTPESVGDLAQDPRVKLMRGDILRINELFDGLEGGRRRFRGRRFPDAAAHPKSAARRRGQRPGHDECLRGVPIPRCQQGDLFLLDRRLRRTDRRHHRRDTPWTWSNLQPGAALYAASKIMGENLGKLYHDRHGVKSISLRYSSVYGERQHLRGVNSVYIIDTYDRLKRGERPVIPDDGREVHDYIHVADVARANLMAMESDVSRESFNVATGTATTLNRLVEIVQKITGTNLTPEYKTPAGKIRAAVSTKLDFSIEKIERMIGWKPQISFEDGIRRTLAWRAKEQQKVS